MRGEGFCPYNYGRCWHHESGNEKGRHEMYQYDIIIEDGKKGNHFLAVSASLTDLLAPKNKLQSVRRLFSHQTDHETLTLVRHDEEVYKYVFCECIR